MVVPRNTPVEDRFGSQIRSEKEVNPQTFFSFQTVYNRKFHIIVAKNHLLQALTCRLAHL